jgi:hypothetical protein
VNNPSPHCPEPKAAVHRLGDQQIGWETSNSKDLERFWIQQPNFEDLAYWNEKVKELGSKIYQIKYGLPGPPPGLGRRQVAISNVSKQLYQLAELGRPGQWILHTEDLYEPGIDTRGQSRKPNEEIPIRGLTYKGVPLEDSRLVWAGKGPQPDFEDAYWEDKVKELEAKVKQIKDGLVHPQFTLEELLALKSMERQEGHFFRTCVMRKKQDLQNKKNSVVSLLEHIAALGRPGQWILHHEDLYHPYIDTRPQSRKSNEGIPIRGFTHNGVPISHELLWAGKGPQPDFEDLAYWEGKVEELGTKMKQVKDGLVHPQFTPEELLALESMERQEDHFFCASEKVP